MLSVLADESAQCGGLAHWALEEGTTTEVVSMRRNGRWHITRPGIAAYADRLWRTAVNGAVGSPVGHSASEGANHLIADPRLEKVEIGAIALPGGWLGGVPAGPRFVRTNAAILRAHLRAILILTHTESH